METQKLVLIFIYYYKERKQSFSILHQGLVYNAHTPGLSQDTNVRTFHGATPGFAVDMLERREPNTFYRIPRILEEIQTGIH